MLAILLPLPCGATPAAPAQVQNEESVVSLGIGQKKEVRVPELVRASVKDTTIADIQDIAPEKVILLGINPGETWLDCAQAGHTRTLVRVKVAGIGTESASESGGKASESHASPSRVAPAPQDTTSSARPTVQVEAVGGRLQITVSPMFGVDSERILTLTPPSEPQESTAQTAAAGGQQPLHDGAHHEEEPSSPDIAGPSEGALTVRRSFQVLPISFRYQASSRDALTLTLPYIRRSEERSFGGRSGVLRNSGLGDVELGFNRAFRRRRPPVGQVGGELDLKNIGRNPWEGLAGLSLHLPTGSHETAPQPQDPPFGRKPPLGTGHYEAGAYLSLRTLADPVAANVSVGLNYTFPRKIGAATVKPGLGYSLSAGVNYALRGRWVLTEQISFSRRTNVFLETSDSMRAEKIDQSYLTHSFLHQGKRGDRSFRGSLSVGLNDPSLDYIFSLDYQFRR